MNVRTLMIIAAAIASSLILFADPNPTAGTKSHRILEHDGTPVDEHFFPIAVWLQAPRNAARFKAAGINLYIGLWNGPTDAQLSELERRACR